MIQNQESAMRIANTLLRRALANTEDERRLPSRHFLLEGSIELPLSLLGRFLYAVHTCNTYFALSAAPATPNPAISAVFSRWGEEWKERKSRFCDCGGEAKTSGKFPDETLRSHNGAVCTERVKRPSCRTMLSVALYGEVLECELTGHEHPVAVKCISLTRATERRRQVHATREMDNPVVEERVAAVLEAKGGHCNVVQSYFHFVHDRRLYLVNELCGGGDLHSLMAKRFAASRFLEEHEVLPLMRQVLAGVHYLHTTIGVAHRDLSLENVLLSRGVCKITDFGLSTDAGRECDGGQVGKEFYMAPEVVAGDRYDPVLADVWSLGIMWFILLTGSPLLSLASPSSKGFEAFAQHGVGVIFESWGYSNRISKDTISLLERMLQVDPTQRISLSQVLAHPTLTA
ncbi:hypothetical protein PsorP6_010741 [Peronosclerospora sorghi]|uniref:Uncharacterized protein n=1 Tax=Peronosclerospora sorghi TaxID=230839 RepID=A0ACC0VU21_9STRA|nr:hypothetical protein PsorP6_010741 [Peronosclerospora sorghi]